MNKLTYEDCKELKDNNFPFKNETYKEIYPPGVEMIYGNYIGAGMSEVLDQGQVRIPTLEELIEACGEDFFQLRRQHNPDLPVERATWWKAISNRKEPSDSYFEDDHYLSRKGSSPSQAVKNLWKALNRK